jgi:uncharacterized damage-inducible protein DinB
MIVQGEPVKSRVPKWFGRKFDFSFPVEIMPNICTRLRGTTPRLQDMLRGRTRDVFTRKAQGHWSVLEEAGHLLTLEPLWLARAEDYVKGHAELTAADLTNQATDDANFNSQGLEEVLGEFWMARGQLLARVEGLDAAALSRMLVHPRMKVPMRLVDHLYFVAEHDDHHLARIWELVEGR